jgi:hypothetical protein
MVSFSYILYHLFKKNLIDKNEELIRLVNSSNIDFDAIRLSPVFVSVFEFC